MKDLPDEMKPTMEVILAHWYWQFFQQNRWRFMQRTATDQPPGDDINSWDLTRILAEIDKHFTLALQNEDLLRKTPVETFNELLAKGTMPDATRPTMYDFVVHEALTFYTAGEQAGAMVQNAFVLQADSPIFAPTAEFVAWNIESPDAQSATIKAVRLFQKLEAFHQQDPDPTALAEAELDRLVFGYNTAAGEEKGRRYKAALERFVQQHEAQPISARAREAWGQVLRGERQLVEARQVALPGWQKFPDSVGRPALLQLDSKYRSERNSGFDRAGVEQSLAGDPSALSQPDQGPFPRRALRLGEIAGPRKLLSRRLDAANCAKNCWLASPTLPGPTICPLPRTIFPRSNSSRCQTA